MVGQVLPVVRTDRVECVGVHVDERHLVAAVGEQTGDVPAHHARADDAGPHADPSTSGSGSRLPRRVRAR